MTMKDNERRRKQRDTEDRHSDRLKDKLRDRQIEIGRDMLFVHKNSMLNHADGQIKQNCTQVIY